MREARTWRIIEAGAIVLFTFQAVRVLLSILFGLVYDALFDGEGMAFLAVAAALCVVMLGMPAFAAAEGARARSNLRMSAILCALARVPLSIDWPPLRLVAGILVVAFANLYLATLLSSRARALVPAACLGVVSDQLLRALGHTYDLGLRLWWLPIQAVLALGIVFLATRLARAELTGDTVGQHEQAGFGAGVSYGSGLFLLASLLALPNAAARWAGGSYPLMVPILMALALLPLWPGLSAWFSHGRTRSSLWLGPALALVLLAGLALGDRGLPVASAAALCCAGIAFWLLWPRALSARGGSARLGMIVGMVCFMLLSVCHALSYTYAYTSAAFRGVGLPTFLVSAALAVGFALPLPVEKAVPDPAAASRPTWLLAAGGGCCLLAVLASLPASPRLAADASAIRLGTYNIHYGFDTHWHLSLEAQARTIERSGADVVALQEMDTGRLTSFGIDDALWLAERLGMEAVYLPTVEHTTGIAVLSRLRVLESAGQLLPSMEEPTGIIRVTVSMGKAPLRVHGTWLGLSPEERARQLVPALEFIGEGRATLSGDLNSTPDSPVYSAMLAHGFLDPFVAGGFPADPTDPAESPQKRIDFVWLRGLQPRAAQVLDSLASDHRMVVVEAE
jgi:endonuclease/exonuclease/phosphatase family metal-dependent hydrolase